MIVITGSLFQLFGPLSSIQGNSVYYSGVLFFAISRVALLGVVFNKPIGKAPKPQRHPNIELPHVTIQMPVYKEGLKG